VSFGDQFLLSLDSAHTSRRLGAARGLIAPMTDPIAPTSDTIAPTIVSRIAPTR
jgi:hypothetical protein